MIFGGLGVLNDVAMTQAATVEELRSVDPTIGSRALYGRTMNVGIAHLAATVNTLVFAYLGTALPLLVLFSIQIRGLGFPLNEEIIAVEVARTLIGSVGIVLTVPITTAIAVQVMSRRARRVPGAGPVSSVRGAWGAERTAAAETPAPEASATTRTGRRAPPFERRTRVNRAVRARRSDRTERPRPTRPGQVDHPGPVGSGSVSPRWPRSR